MPPRLRKLIGTLAIVALVVVYAFLSMMLAIAILPGTAKWVQLTYYAIAGILWALPAGLIIKWMNKIPAE